MPILSICIPTYNRAGYIYFTLKSITEQKIFKDTNYIEIVVSDNFSTDLTQRIVKIFTDKYPDKIIYNKNKENIGDNNFAKALSLGKGEVLKLHNDNFMFLDGALDKIISTINSVRKDKTIIFFANSNSPLNKDFLCNNLNEFLSAASYLTTWIAAFSVWREDFEKIENFTRNVHTNLSQTDIIFDLSASGKKILVYNKLVFEGYNVSKKGGYNISKIFGKNYLSFLKPYLKTGQLDKKNYEAEKKRLLLNHIIPMRFSNSRREKGWVFSTDGFWRHLIGDYWYNTYFYFSIFKVLRLMLDAEINLIGRKLNKNSYQKYWRKRNKHNKTTIAKGIDETKVFVGKNVEGLIAAKFTTNENEILIIDDNVKIKPDTCFNFDNEELILVK
jgi:glycosyltransferase involved in cell wall biosynthesis